jgi:hypothetical protein
MDNLESRLKDLSLRAPSHELDDRVLGLKPERPARALRRVPLWSAVAASLLMAGFGFAAGVTCPGARSRDKLETRPPIRVELICDSPSGTNPFDFTAASSGFPAREWELKVITDTDTST